MTVEIRTGQPNSRRLTTKPQLLVVAGTLVAFGSVVYSTLEMGIKESQAKNDFPDQAPQVELDDARSLRSRAYAELDQAILIDQTILEISKLIDMERQKRALTLLQSQERVEKERKTFIAQERSWNSGKMLVGMITGLALAVAGATIHRRRPTTLTRP